MIETLPVPTRGSVRRPAVAVVVALLLSSLPGCKDGVEPSPGTPPTVSITSPSEGQVFDPGEPITFSGSAVDEEDGALTGNALGWFSSIDRQLGNGATVVRSDLSSGDHEIRLTAVNSRQATANAFVHITVRPPNSLPSAAIASPSDGQTFHEGESIEFSGSASDLEDGTLSGGSLVWTSSRDGQLGTGGSFARGDLSAGDHTITLTATDSRGGSGTAQVSVTVEPNEPPTPTIAGPADGQTFSVGQTVTFEGSATDPEQGPLPGTSLVWASSLDGQLGSGASLQRSDLSEGVHVVTLTATDALGATGSAAISITVANLPPVPAITAPIDGRVYLVGETVPLRGSADDPEDGPLSGGALVWTSSRDGALGTGAALDRSDLSEGDHTIRLTATDTRGASASAEVTITLSTVAQNPDAIITSPTDGAAYEPGDAVAFAGSASDPQDGPLSGGSLVWTSSRDGPIGTGTSFNRSDLSLGQHVITLTATDSDGRTGTAAVTVTVFINQKPTASIVAPANGQVFQQGQSIGFQGTGNDPEDGSLGGGALRWVSNRDGFLGTGTSFQRSDLSTGSHRVTLTANDSRGATGSTFVDIVVNAPPTASIFSPTNGAVFESGESVTFSGSGSDPEDGPRTPSWSSSRDGFLANATAFSRSNLSTGVHVITMTVTDTDGGTASAQRTITVKAPVSFRNDILPMFKSDGWRVAGGKCIDCHFSGGQDPEFGNADANVPYAQLTQSGWNPGDGNGRVIPGNDGAGDLLCKITDGGIPGTSCTTIAGGSDDMRMIQTAIDRIKLWIKQGAPNN